MNEPKEKKPTGAAPEAPSSGGTTPGGMTSGETLRAARMAKKLGLEEISSAIHIRVAQLRALEEGNIDALPGMTYAQGFVRSYANYLKINSAEVVNKFKMEHGAMKPAMPELHIPTPIGENRLPDPVMVGVAAACVIVLLLSWAIFSGGGDDSKTIASSDNVQIVSGDEVQDSSGDALPPSTAESTMTGPSPSPTVPPVIPENAPAAENTLAQPVIPEVAPEAAAVPINPASEAAPLASAPAEGAPPAETAQAETPAAAPAEEEIIIKRSNSRIVIRAKESSWIQVVNAKKKVVAKKVLKAGEQYFVPLEQGMNLVTSNAGGIDIYVDGNKTSPIGRTGEIIRVPLEAGWLTKKRTRVNQY